MSSPVGFRLLCGVMTAYFCFATIVQLNDPDAPRWIALYSAAAVVTALAAFRPLPRLWPALLGLIALGWALTLLPEAVGTSFRQLFETWQMMSPGMEVGRESLGLLIVAAWMAVLYRRAGRANG
jgi:hypothetical protein